MKELDLATSGRLQRTVNKDNILSHLEVFRGQIDRFLSILPSTVGGVDTTQVIHEAINLSEIISELRTKLLRNSTDGNNHLDVVSSRSIDFNRSIMSTDLTSSMIRPFSRSLPIIVGSEMRLVGPRPLHPAITRLAADYKFRIANEVYPFSNIRPVTYYTGRSWERVPFSPLAHPSEVYGRYQFDINPGMVVPVAAPRRDLLSLATVREVSPNVMRDENLRISDLDLSGLDIEGPLDLSLQNETDNEDST